MNWTIKKTIPTLAVPVLEIGIDFCRRLGFEIEWRWPDDPPTHAGLLLDSCSIKLSECDPAVRGDVYFDVDDVSACYADGMARRPWESAASAGAAALRPECPSPRSLRPPDSPVPRDYGLKDFSIIDPWGNNLVFGQTLTGERA